MPLRFGADVFPFGTHVFREPAENVEEVIDYLPRLRALGFNMIKIQESWALDERVQGRVDMGRVRSLIDAAERAGLGVYLGLTMEQAPAWFWTRHPDAFMVKATGQPYNDPTQYLLPCDGKPGPCWHHPAAREEAERFIADAVGQLSSSSAIWTWNTWQEVAFWHNDAGTLGFCYCPHSLTAFRRWLSSRYRDISGLNRAWNTGYGRWEEVEPPRRFSGVPSYADWRFFMDDVYLAEVLEWKTAAVRAADSRGRPVFSHVGFPRIGSGAEWRWARTGDFFGSSNYPATEPFDPWDDIEPSGASEHQTKLNELWNCMMFRNDVLRCATGRGKAFWGAEFQGGPVNFFLHSGRTPDAADIRRWVLAGIAAGMTGISFWNLRSEHMWHEADGFGLTDRARPESERLLDAGELSRALQQHAELFTVGVPPRAEVALVVSEESYLFSQSDDGVAAKLLQADLRGHYGRLWRLGYPADFVEIGLADAAELSQYKVLILPFMLALTDDQAACLVQYVQGGGTLIGSAGPGRFDPYGRGRSSFMFDGAEDLFGARHVALRRVAEPGGARRWTFQPRGWGELVEPADLTGGDELAGHTMRASFWLQQLAPTTGRPVLQDDRGGVFGVRNDHGRGRAYLLGSLTGLSAVAHQHPATDRLFEHLLTTAGVQPDVCGSLLRRRRALGDREAWFLVNQGPNAQTEVIDMQGYRLEQDLLGDAVVADRGADVVVNVPSVGIAVLIVRRS